ncbi:MAG: EamA family transporter [Solirubrobacteraceae bacterium]|nr:EamA family transporter [Solirubrobacteraceae bacterium]
MTSRDRLLALLVPVIWGLNFVILDEGLEDVPPLLFLAMRFTFVALPLVFFVPRPQARWTTVFAIGGAMSFGQFSLLYLGLAAGMPAGLASLVLQVQVMFTILLAWLMLGERSTPKQIAGTLVGFAGLALVAVAHGARAPILPLLLVVGAAASWALGNVVVRRAQVTSGLSLVVWSALVVPIPAVGLSLLVDGPTEVGRALTHLDAVAIGSTAYTVIAASLVGYTIFNGLLARHPAGSVVPYILLVPPVGIASAWAVQGETPTGLELVGALVMMGGVAIATLSLGRSRAADAAPVAPEAGSTTSPAGPERPAAPVLVEERPGPETALRPRAARARG